MAWFYLSIASLLEIGWAVGLKFSGGFTQPGIAAVTIGLMALSLLFLGLAVRELPLGTSYAIWTGIGTVGTVIAGIIWFAEPASLLRLGCIGLILLGVAGLKCSAG